MIRKAVTLAGACLLLCLVHTPASFAEDTLVFIDVVGASGDGDKALAAALSERLLSHGLAIAGTPTPNAYEIQGIVKLGPAKKGRQAVRIDWTILGPDGAQLGNVTQEQEVRQGSLDRKWGGAAEAAAVAAARDILKLIPTEPLQ
ncbi:MAG: hypothetical protein FJX44_02190 [Alphaproteobacteria bacterium]|nr:hypothetical protein [Alphaproteobacteria bacterium]